MDQLIKDGASFPAKPSLNSAPLKALEAVCLKSSTTKRIPVKRRPRIRMLDSMIQSGAYDIEPYRPAVTSNDFILFINLEDLTLEKEKLQNIMSGEPTEYSLKTNYIESSDDDVELDERKMCKTLILIIVIEEIKERRAWLDEMTALNKGDKFKNQIESEIAVVIIPS